jgi:uncharacterized protein YciI
MQMLVAISKYLKPIDEVDQHIVPHKAFLQELIDQKKLLVCGRQNPPVGGVIISREISKHEFETIMAKDPFVIAGVAQYHITEFAPGLIDPCLSS